MKSTVEQLTPTRVRLNVEVPFEELKPEFDRAYKTLAEQVNIQGFRRGKAPAKLIEARVGKDAVLEQVINDAIPSRYAAAVSEHHTKVLGQPEIELSELEYGQSVSFVAEVDVRPEIELPAYDTVAVEVEPLEVSDADVAEQLEALRARFGTLKGVDRPIANGDFVSIDLAASVDGAVVEEAATTGLSHEVGSAQLIDGLDEALVGLNSGESKTFTSTLVAGEFAGKEAEVTVTVGSVKERELPEVDDEFAQLASEFDTVAELTDDLKAKAEQTKKLTQATQIRDNVLAKLLETIEIPLPEGIVKSETDNQIHEVVHQFEHNDELIAQWLESQGKTREEFEADARTGAEKAVRAQLLLDSIADKEDVKVSQQELTEHILFQAQNYGMNPGDFIQEVQQANALPQLMAEVRRGKGLAEVIKGVKVTDTAGNVVDTDSLFEDEAEDEAFDSIEAADDSADETAADETN